MSSPGTIYILNNGFHFIYGFIILDEQNCIDLSVDSKIGIYDLEANYMKSYYLVAISSGYTIKII